MFGVVGVSGAGKSTSLLAVAHVASARKWPLDSRFNVDAQLIRTS